MTEVQFIRPFAASACLFPLSSDVDTWRAWGCLLRNELAIDRSRGSYALVQQRRILPPAPALCLFLVPSTCWMHCKTTVQISHHSQMVQPWTAQPCHQHLVCIASLHHWLVSPVSLSKPPFSRVFVFLSNRNRKGIEGRSEPVSIGFERIRRVPKDLRRRWSADRWRWKARTSRRIRRTNVRIKRHASCWNVGGKLLLQGRRPQEQGCARRRAKEVEGEEGEANDVEDRHVEKCGRDGPRDRSIEPNSTWPRCLASILSP